MKYLIFSDTHLDRNFDKKKFEFLQKIIALGDIVIINGDFWEGYSCTFDEFVRSPWKKLFPLLKKKNTVYIFGNHDKKEYADKRVHLFSVEQTRKYTFQSGENIFHLEHGDRIIPFGDDIIFKRMSQTVSNFLTFLEYLSVKISGMRLIRLVYQQFNEQLKKKVASLLKKNEYLICGHTSSSEIDLKNHYINSGWIKHGIGQYLIIEDGKVTPYEEQYG